MNVNIQNQSLVMGMCFLTLVMRLLYKPKSVSFKIHSIFSMLLK